MNDRRRRRDGAGRIADGETQKRRPLLPLDAKDNFQRPCTEYFRGAALNPLQVHIDFVRRAARKVPCTIAQIPGLKRAGKIASLLEGSLGSSYPQDLQRLAL